MRTRLIASGVLSVFLALVAPTKGAKTVQLTRAEYADRVQAVWTAQIIAVLMAWPHEHQVASTVWLENFPRKYTTAPVDDDWYYEMTYPRDEVRGLVLRRTLKLRERASLTFQAGVDAGRAWELNVYANNKPVLKRVIDGGADSGRNWQEVKIELNEFAGQTVTLRLYQRVLVPDKTPGNAYWKKIEVK